jgi:hypothetical protein
MTPYIEPTQQAGRRFIDQGHPGTVVILNLLRFRSGADYAAHPHLATHAPKQRCRLLAFAQNTAYLAGIGHRAAALEDSRLLPTLPRAVEPQHLA